MSSEIIRIRRSSERSNFIKAMLLVRGAMGRAQKDSSNPFYKSKYSDLAACWDVCEDPLIENGFLVTQSCGLIIHPNHNIITVTTLVEHVSGEWMEGDVVIPYEENTPHAAGSAITYGKRYGLKAIMGMVDEDDDGNAASARQKSPERGPNKSQKRDFGTVSPALLGIKKKISIALMSVDPSERAAFIKQLNDANLTEADAEKLLSSVLSASKKAPF